MTYSQSFVHQLAYYSTSSYPCSYLANKLAKSQIVTPPDAINAASYDVLIQNGFRRSGSYICRPQCDNCQACQSIRLPVADFKPNRSQRRAWAQHHTLHCTLLRPVFLPEHYALYQSYQKSRHPGGGMDSENAAQYRDFLICSRVRSWMVEFRQPSQSAAFGALKMVSVIDQLQDGLSAVYTFYSPEPRQSLGVFNILWQIAQAKKLGLRYLYLGYWIEGCQKMQYKSNFKPYELRQNGVWQPVQG